MIRHTCQFIIDKEAGKPDGKLRFRVKWDHNRNIVAFNPGFRIDPAKWSLETQRCKTNSTHGKKRIPASEINRELSRYEEAAENTFRRFENAGHEPTKEEFKTAFLEAIGKKRAEDKRSLSAALEEFVKEQSVANSWTAGTKKKFSTLKSHLEDFNPELDFSNLSGRFIPGFIDFCREKYQLRNSTLIKQTNLLKWFLRWCARNGLLQDVSILDSGPKLKTTQKKVIFLEWDELMNLYRFPVQESKQYLSRVRDVFCFCCFTGLRYSDVAAMKRSQIVNDAIVITTVKTSDTLKIELNDYSRAILDRYRAEAIPGGHALPVISNQRMNEYLKELCELAGIDSPVTQTYYRGSERIEETVPKYALIGTHCGRRTFICNALMLGIPPQVVMKWTGHKDYSAMRPYIDVADAAKAEAMERFNRK